MMAEGHDDGAGLAHVEIFLPMDAAMLTRRDIERHCVFALEHDTIGAGIDPTLFWILGDDQIIGSDIATAIKFVPARDRKSFEIDVFLDAIFEYRRVFNILR